MYLTKKAFGFKKKVTTNSLSSSPSLQLDITPALQKYLDSCVSSKHCHCERSHATQFTSIPSHDPIGKQKLFQAGNVYFLLHLITNNKHSRHYKSDSLQSMQMTTTSFSSLTNTKAHPTNLQQATPHSITPFLSQTVHKRNLLFLLSSLSFFLRSLLRESTLNNGTKGRKRKNACLHITAVKPQQTRPKRTATV